MRGEIRHGFVWLQGGIRRSGRDAARYRRTLRRGLWDMSKEIERRSRSTLLSEFSCAEAAPSAFRADAAAARQVIETYAQRIHRGHGGTRGVVLSRAALQWVRFPESTFGSRRDRRLSSPENPRFSGEYADRNGDRERMSVVYRCRTDRVLR